MVGIDEWAISTPLEEAKTVVYSIIARQKHSH